MALTDIDEKARPRKLTDLDHRREFDKVWDSFTQAEQDAMNAAIATRLDTLAEDAEAGRGAIMNTSIEGGFVNPFNGKRGDWDGTPWEPIYPACGQSEQLAGMFFGNLWKLRIIEHSADWIGIRNDPVNRPTFPNKGISLNGKTYFIPGSQRRNPL